MTVKISEELLHQTWVHSHEEDTETEMVFRPSSYRFPPSRGRKSFELKAGGSLLQTGPGPADVPQQRQGTWQLINDTELAFFFEPATEPQLVMQIVSVEKNRLVVRRK
ncbi:MAG: hypothetical protein NTU98_02995 [Bacteroidetes bacterium]|nr:hypothetical protein [Bacteroidota bacterium]